jgi:hypothetical protein
MLKKIPLIILLCSYIINTISIYYGISFFINENSWQLIGSPIFTFYIGVFTLLFNSSSFYFMFFNSNIGIFLLICNSIISLWSNSLPILHSAGKFNFLFFKDPSLFLQFLVLLIISLIPNFIIWTIYKNIKEEKNAITTS